MTLLIAGLLVFVAAHLVTTMTGTRGRLVARLGRGGYMGLYSLVSAVGLAMIVAGYARTPYVALWDAPVWMRHVTFALMLPVFPLLVGAYLPGQTKRVIHHPMLTAVIVWACAHLLIRGTLAAAILFAALLAWAVYDLVSVRGRERAGLLAIKTGPWRNDVIALAIGLAVYLVMINWGHKMLIGVPILPPNLPPWVPTWLGG